MNEQDLWRAYVEAFGQRIIKEVIHSKEGEAKEGIEAKEG